MAPFDRSVAERSSLCNPGSVLESALQRCHCSAPTLMIVPCRPSRPDNRQFFLIFCNAEAAGAGTSKTACCSEVPGANPAATHPRPPVVRANSCSTPGRKPTSRVYLVVTCFDRLGNLRPDVGRPSGSISLQAAQNAGTPVLEFLLLLASAGMPTDQHTSKQAPRPSRRIFRKIDGRHGQGCRPTPTFKG